MTSLKNLKQKKITKNGGGKTNFKVGIWADKNGNQKHITTAIFGILPTEAFLLDTQNDKIIFYVFSESQKQILDKKGVKVFEVSKDGKKNGTQKYQNYAIIQGIDDNLFKDIVKINGGIKKYNKNKSPEILEKYSVKRFSKEEFEKFIK